MKGRHCSSKSKLLRSLLKNELLLESYTTNCKAMNDLIHFENNFFHDFYMKPNVLLSTKLLFLLLAYRQYNVNLRLKIRRI